jgi:hypothetical protein
MVAASSGMGGGGRDRYLGRSCVSRRSILETGFDYYYYRWKQHSATSS